MVDINRGPWTKPTLGETVRIFAPTEDLFPTYIAGSSVKIVEVVDGGMAFFDRTDLGGMKTGLYFWRYVPETQLVPVLGETVLAAASDDGSAAYWNFFKLPSGYTIRDRDTAWDAHWSNEHSRKFTTGDLGDVINHTSYRINGTWKRALHIKSRATNQEGLIPLRCVTQYRIPSVAVFEAAQKQCSCNMTTLLQHGCQCGSIKPYEATF